MYFLGYGTKLSNVLTVQERMKLLSEKEKNRKNEKYKLEVNETRKNKSIYISSKYKLN